MPWSMFFKLQTYSKSYHYISKLHVSSLMGEEKLGPDIMDHLLFDCFDVESFVIFPVKKKEKRSNVEILLSLCHYMSINGKKFHAK